MPEILKGLDVSDYAHPDDLAAINALKTVGGINDFLTKIGDKSNQLVIRTRALGHYVRLTKDNSPRIYNLIADVCKILDYETMPEIYAKRSYSLEIDVSGAEKPTLIIPDYLLDNFDDNFMRFIIGRAISKLKSDYLKFYTIAKVTIEVVEFAQSLPDSINILFARWMQKAELTADRGGLLACQNCKTAIRYLMHNAGMPIQFTEDVSIPEYIEACKVDNKLLKAGKGLLTLTNCTGWYNDRIIELFNWYTTGEYGEILDEYLF